MLDHSNRRLEPDRTIELQTLGRRTRRTVRFNIGTALGLKLVLAIGAIFGVVSLAAAVLVGDLGASIAVTLNAIRLAGTHTDASVADTHNIT